jgi:hypothetical protein
VDEVRGDNANIRAIRINSPKTTPDVTFVDVEWTTGTLAGKPERLGLDLTAIHSSVLVAAITAAVALRANCEILLDASTAKRSVGQIVLKN